MSVDDTVTQTDNDICILCNRMKAAGTLKPKETTLGFTSVRACDVCGEYEVQGKSWCEWLPDLEGETAELEHDPTDTDMAAATEIMDKGSSTGLTKRQAAEIIARHFAPEREATGNYIELLSYEDESVETMDPHEYDTELTKAFVELPEWLRGRL